MISFVPVQWADIPAWLRMAANSINAIIPRVPLSGNGTPEGAVKASVGTLYTRLDGGTGTTLYVKESGTGNTGWVAK